VPRRAKVVVVLAGLWLLSPVDLLPEFPPVIGPLDDLAVVALALRSLCVRPTSRRAGYTPSSGWPRFSVTHSGVAVTRVLLVLGDNQYEFVYEVEDTGRRPVDTTQLRAAVDDAQGRRFQQQPATARDTRGVLQPGDAGVITARFALTAGAEPAVLYVAEAGGGEPVPIAIP
jgi:hypothetical protein